MSFDATLQLLTSMGALYTQLSAILIDFAPKDEEERAQLKALLARRDDLRDQLRAALSSGFSSSAGELEQAAAGLAAGTAKLSSQQQGIEQVKAALAVASNALGIIAKLVGAAA
jgi:hypothetical protein